MQLCCWHLWHQLPVWRLGLSKATSRERPLMAIKINTAVRCVLLLYSSTKKGQQLMFCRDTAACMFHHLCNQRNLFRVICICNCLLAYILCPSIAAASSRSTTANGGRAAASSARHRTARLWSTPATPALPWPARQPLLLPSPPSLHVCDAMSATRSPKARHSMACQNAAPVKSKQKAAPKSHSTARPLSSSMML
jgi:hypothetical protein